MRFLSDTTVIVWSFSLSCTSVFTQDYLLSFSVFFVCIFIIWVRLGFTFHWSYYMYDPASLTIWLFDCLLPCSYSYSVQNIVGLEWTFMKLDTSMFAIVYRTLVRSKLENCVQAPICCLKSISDISGKLQEAATRSFLEIWCLPYTEHLEEFCTCTLFYRRLKGDLILMHWILRNDFVPSRSFPLLLKIRTNHRT